jgi:hypothetical protein
MKVTAELLREKKVALHGSVDMIIESLLEVRDQAGYGDDFMINCHFELAGFQGAEVEEQMQCFAERVVPELARACGGRVDQPASTVDLTSGLPEAEPTAS